MTREELDDDDFGACNGSAVENKAIVLRDVDRALGVQKPPRIEYIFVEPSMYRQRNSCVLACSLQKTTCLFDVK